MGGAFLEEWKRNRKRKGGTSASTNQSLLSSSSSRRFKKCREKKTEKLTNQLRSQPRFLQIQPFPSHNLPIPILYQLHRRSFQRPPTLTLPSIPTRLTLPITLLTLTLVRSLPSAAVLRVVVKLVLSVPAHHARRRRGRVGEGPSLIVGGS